MGRKLIASLLLALSFNMAAGTAGAQLFPDQRMSEDWPPGPSAYQRLNKPKQLRPTAKQPLQTALIVDAGSGSVLIEQGASRQVYPASLTKLMTLYLTFEALESGKLKIYQRLPVSAHAASFRSLHLHAGDVMTVEQAIIGLTVKSANDAAVVLAEALGGTDKKFAKMMNDKAAKLGMNATRFRNPSGLPDPLQVTTAKDMVILSQAHLRDFPQYRKYFEKKEFTFKGITYPGHNALMKAKPEIDFGKTGYINASGYNLVVSAKRDDRRLLGVVFGGRTAAVRDKKMEELLEKGFDKVFHAPPSPDPEKPAKKMVALSKKANGPPAR